MFGKLKNAGKDIFKINNHNVGDFTSYCDTFNDLVIDTKEIYLGSYDVDSFEQCVEHL